MAKQPIFPHGRPDGPAHFAPGIAINTPGKLIFVSGMIPRQRDGRLVGAGDVGEQARQVCENIKAVLAEAGATMKDVCQVTVYLRHITDSERVNAVRREYFGVPPPASTLVEVSRLASPDFLVQISAIALVPAG